MELRAIESDVYACLQPDRGLGWSNSGLIARGPGLVVDTFWDLPRTRQMIDLYAGVHRGAVGRLVNTHHNGDHCWGNQLFVDSEIIGHRLCAEGMKNDIPPSTFMEMMTPGVLPPELERIAEGLRDYDFSGIEITPPTTLVEERMELDVGGEEVEILYVGPAHTAGDVIVHLPKKGIVFGGDVVWAGCTPIGWEGTYANWLSALDRITALEPQIVVPGHGPVTDCAGIAELRDYLVYVRAQARVAFDADLPVIEACMSIELGPYAEWTEPERIAFNVERAYREFRGQAWDEPIDGLAWLAEVAAVAELRERH